MKPVNKQKWTAYALIIITVALLAVTVWLVLAHRPPMDRPGPPPEGPALFDGPRPDGPPPGGMAPPDGPRPLRPEAKMALVSLLVVIMTLCVLAAVKLLRKQPAVIPDSSAPLAPSASAPEAPATINFKTDYKTVTVALADIRYIESMSEYVKIYLDSQPDPLVVLYSLKRLSAELPASRFMRIHRSYIVALDRIREANASSVVLDSPVTLPVGESYRPAFKEYLASRS